MSDINSLSVDEYKQLIKYYKDKSSEIELSLMLFQLNSTREIAKMKSKHEEELIELKKENNKALLEMRNAIDHLTRQKNKAKVSKKTNNTKKV